MIAQQRDDDQAVRRAILDAIFQLRHHIVLVDSPPGAGKTRLVEDIVAYGVLEMGWRVAVATPKKEQSYDLIVRLRRRFPRVAVHLLHTANDQVRDDVLRCGATLVDDARMIPGGPGVVISTIDKQAFAIHKYGETRFDLLVVDEAYQTTYAKALPLFPMARQFVLVGDPGQLSPFFEVDEERFEAARDHILRPLPVEQLERFPDTPRYRMNVTRRLPQDTVDVVQPAFYPTMPFRALAEPEERRLAFGAAGMGDRIDRALDAIEHGSTIVVVSLPPLDYSADVDPELSAEAARTVERIISRGPRWVSQGLALGQAHIGYCDSRVVSGTETRARLNAAGRTLSFADTPEVIQGRQAPITIVKHPLSAVARAQAFNLDPGRLCVMLTRHQLACVVLSRDNVSRVLEAYEHDCGERRAGREDVVWNGFRAHRDFWRRMNDQGRVFR